MIPKQFRPLSAVLDVRTCERLPKRVRSIQIADTANIVRGESLTLLAGYNTEFTQNDVTAVDGGRLVTDLTIGAEPGSGLGRTPGCLDVDVVLRRINGTAGDSHGNFVFDAGSTRDGVGGGCYRVERPGTLVSEDPRQVELTPHTLQLTNDCGPCCDCAEYMAVYEAIRRLRERYLALGQRATTLRDQYRINLHRWNDAGSERLASPLRLSIFPLACGKLGVTGAYCNSTGDFIANLQLKFNFGATVTTATTIEEVCGGTFRAGNYERNTPAQAGYIPPSSREAYKLGGTYPVLSAFFTGIPAGGLAMVTFQIEFQGCTTDDMAAVSLEALDPGSGSAITYNAGWPTHNTPVAVDAINVRSGLLPNDPCTPDGCAAITDNLGVSDTSL